MYKFASVAGVMFTCGVIGAIVDDDIEQQLSAVLRQLNDVETWLGEADERLVRLQAEVASADKSISSLGNEINFIKQELKRIEADIAQLEEEHMDIDNNREIQAERVAVHLRQTYKNANQNFLKIFLNQNDPSKIERFSRYHNIFAKASIKLLNDYRDIIESLSNNTAILEQQKASKLDRIRSLELQQQKLSSERSRREELIVTLQQQIATKQSMLARTSNNRNRLARLIAAIPQSNSEKSIAENDSVFEPRLNALPVTGEIQRRYGDSKVDGQMQWEGMLIRASAGTKVHAMDSGRVVFADWLQGFGLIVIIDHGKTLLSLYAYCDSIYKRLGDRVEAGEIIAMVGRSGGQSSDGLYFEVRRDSKSIDPLTWLDN